ncbi:MAG: Flp pilus assembly protein CpaB [Candidatus Omnitrophica bacterium]|nr:Flp pilus assembly protein CpaB [Candidatus Omnitrophota bacterium]
MHNWKRHLPLALATVFAILSSVSVYLYLNDREGVVHATPDSVVPVVVAKQDMALGMKLAEADLGVENWPKESVNDQFFASPKQLIGRTLRSSLIAGEPVTTPKLMQDGESISSLIPSDMRGVTITIPKSNTLARVLERGSIVDVIAMFDNGEASPTTKVVAQAVRVLSVYDRTDPTAPDKTTKFMEVTLMVTPNDAEWLLIAANKGVMQIVVRNERQ